MISDNMKSALERVKKTTVKEELHKLSTSFDTVYNAGQLSEKELMTLDVKIMRKLALLDQAA